MNWNLIQTLHVLAEQGTLTDAAKKLNVNATTISRRLATLEVLLEKQLFQRKDGRYVASPASEITLQYAASMAQAAEALLDAEGSSEKTLGGVVRITSIESIIADCLAPSLHSFRESYPNIQLEFLGTESNLSFARREVDIAIRLARPKTGNVVTRKLADIGYAVYGSVKTVQENLSKVAADEGMPMEQLSEFDWITYDDELAHLPESKWVSQVLDTKQPIIKSSNAHTITKLIQLGVGVSLLPCYRDTAESSLIRLSGKRPVLTREAWLMVHNDVRETARVRKVLDWLIDLFETNRDRFTGEQLASKPPTKP